MKNLELDSFLVMGLEESELEVINGGGLVSFGHVLGKFVHLLEGMIVNPPELPSATVYK